MGLSTVYGIIKEMEGDIRVYSEEGLGSTFEILIPEQIGETQTSEDEDDVKLKTGKGKVLLVDDEPAIIKWTSQVLERLGYKVAGFMNGFEAIEKFRQDSKSFDLILTDLAMPQMTGIELVKQIKEIRSDIPIILCTGFSDGLTKEKIQACGISEMVISKRALKPFLAVDCGALPETLVESTLFGHEKGSFTGAQKKQDGLITQADGGTLMLDEVGDLPLNAQKTFLRTLQERCVRPVGGASEKFVDFRLIAATNLDLDQMVKERLFRKDLLYRIRAMEIKLPPLREREKDIEEIIIKKVHELARRYGIETKAISPEFFQTLAAHNWPGNVRELINVLEYVLATAGQDPTLFSKHLPPEYRTAGLDFKPVMEIKSRQQPFVTPGAGDELPTLKDYRIKMDRDYLKMLLNTVQGNRDTASRISGISRSRLYGLLKKHNLPGFSSS